MECTICLNPLEEDDAISSTECGHKFHSKCIFKSIAFKIFKCPNCRQELTSGPKENVNAARQEMIRTLIAEDITYMNTMPAFVRHRIRPPFNYSVYDRNGNNSNNGENTDNDANNNNSNEIGSTESNNNNNYENAGNNNNNNNGDENDNVDNNTNSHIQKTIRSFTSDLMRMHQNASTNTDGNNGLENHIRDSALQTQSQTIDNVHSNLLQPVHTTVNSINTPITPFSYRRREMLNIPNNIRRGTRIIQDERMPPPNQMNSFTPYHRRRRISDVNMTEMENDQYVPPLLSNILSRNFIATSHNPSLDTHNSTNDYQTNTSTNTSDTSTNTSPDTLPFISNVPQTVRLFMTEINAFMD